MSIDFWNNPILVTAVRVNLRGGRVVHVLALYPVLLMLGGAAVPYFFPPIAKDWPRYAFQILIIGQFAICGLIAAGGTSHSLKSEVVNQTIDFLRMAPLTPWQILIGKLLGACALPFFAAVASFPVGLLCWAMGGVDLLTFLLLYVNLLVYVPLSGSGGLVMRVELRDDKRVDNVSFLGLTGWAAGIPALMSLAMDPPMRFLVLVLLPPVMVLAAFLNLHVMARTLESPFKPPVSKWLAYWLLLAIDVVAAGFAAGLPMPMAARGVVYWAVDVLMSVYLIMAVTPWRESLRSWAWRFRGHVPALRDAWLGDRSENGPAVLTFAAIGVAVFSAAFLPLGIITDGSTEVVDDLLALGGATALSLVLVFAFGFIFQWNSLIFGRTGSLLMLFFIGAMMAPGYIGMVDPELAWVMELCPFTYYGRWFHAEGDGSVRFLPVVLGFLICVALIARSSVRARLRWLGRVVDRKLEKMGVMRERG